MRVGHFLKANHSTRIPGTVIVAHCQRQLNRPMKSRTLVETLDRWYAVTFRIDAGRVTRRHEFGDEQPGLFWGWCREQCDARRPAWLFLHKAMHQCSLLNLWAELDSGKFWLRHYGDRKTNAIDRNAKGEREKPGFLCLCDRPFIAELKHGRGRLKVVDIRNYLDQSLSELDRESTDYTPLAWQSKAHIDLPQADPVVCCAVLELAVFRLLNWWRDSDAGVWKASVGGLAWNNFRHRHMRHGISPTVDPDALRLEQDSYFGGIVECRWRGEVKIPVDNTLNNPARKPPPGWGILNGSLYHLDIRSMYPAIMRDEYFPCRLITHKGGLRVSDLVDLLRAYAVVANVGLESPNVPFPVRVGDKVASAVGRFNTTLSGPELAFAANAGLLTRVYEACVYVRGRIFREYATSWIAAREKYRAEGNKVYEAFAKLMANSLYGRFAMRRNTWVDRPDKFAVEPWSDWPEYDHLKGRVTSFRSISHYVQELNRESMASGCFPAIASYVTSYGRVLMRRLLSGFPERSVLYVDTDGIIVTDDGYRHAVEHVGIGGERAGSLRLVRQYQSGVIVGCRAYRLDETDCHAGLPVTAKEVRPGVWEYNRPESPNELIKNHRGGRVVHKIERWAYDQADRNGFYDRDGWLIQPVLDLGDSPT